MMFSRALYYPTIDIKNERWLKSAALFWDSIETIVPESRSDNPYRNNTTRAFYDSGILRPHIVNPWADDVAGLENDIRVFMKTKEGKRLLNKRFYISSVANKKMNERETWEDYLNELNVRMRREYDDIYIHADKLPYTIQEELKNYRNPDGFILTTAEFLGYYMTLLANNVCRQDGLSLLTDKTMVNDLSNRILVEKIGAEIQKDQMDAQLDTMLYKIVIDSIQIDPTTPVDKIIRFKRKYSDELGRFRMEMSQLTNLERGGDTFRAISQQARNIYENGIMPSVNDLKKALDDSTIKCMVDNYYNYVISSAAPVAFTMIDMPITQTLPISAGLAVGYTIIGACQARRELMRNSPYTYLMKAKQRFSTARL